MLATLRPGDRVVATYPGYQSLHEIARAMGCSVALWELEEAGGRWGCGQAGDSRWRRGPAAALLHGQNFFGQPACVGGACMPEKAYAPQGAGRRLGFVQAPPALRCSASFAYAKNRSSVAGRGRKARWARPRGSTPLCTPLQPRAAAVPSGAAGGAAGGGRGSHGGGQLPSQPQRLAAQRQRVAPHRGGSQARAPQSSAPCRAGTGCCWVLLGPCSFTAEAPRGPLLTLGRTPSPCLPGPAAAGQLAAASGAPLALQRRPRR